MNRLDRLEARHSPPQKPVVLLVERDDGQRYRQTGEHVSEEDMQALLATHETVITICPAHPDRT